MSHKYSYSYTSVDMNEFPIQHFQDTLLQRDTSFSSDTLVIQED